MIRAYTPFLMFIIIFFYIQATIINQSPVRCTLIRHNALYVIRLYIVIKCFLIGYTIYLSPDDERSMHCKHITLLNLLNSTFISITAITSYGRFNIFFMKNITVFYDTRDKRLLKRVLFFHLPPVYHSHRDTVSVGVLN